MTTINELKTKHAAITERINAIEAEAKQAGSIPSTTYREQLHLEAEAAGMAAGIKAAEGIGVKSAGDAVEGVKADEGSQGIKAEIAALGGEPGIKSHTTGNHLALTGVGAKAAGRALASKIAGASIGAKSGSAVTGTPLEGKSPLALDQVPTSFLNLLTVKQHQTPVWEYMKQTVRTNRAGVWTTGKKAESDYQWEKVAGNLSTVAHTSGGMDRYMMMDNDSLAGFLASEMLAGLAEKVEDQALNGDGTGANMTGVLATAGIGTQAFDTDLVKTFRKAITSLKDIGRNPGVFVMSPATWEDVELSRNASGAFDLARSAIDPAKQQLHGVPVVQSTALPEGVAMLLDLEAVQLDMDTNGIIAVWGEDDGDFTSNQSRLLVEGRFGVSVLRPTGVVKIDTAGE